MHLNIKATEECRFACKGEKYVYPFAEQFRACLRHVYKRGKSVKVTRLRDNGPGWW